MATRPLGWFVKNGCELTSPSYELFVGVFHATDGDPCRECNCKSTCPAWPRVYTLEAKSIDRVIEIRRCGQCNSPLNMKKVERRGGLCACGAKV